MMYSTHAPTSPRGFTLLIAVVMVSVLVSVGLALLDITYKQVLLAQAATQSQYAFYNADSALECALYWDQKQNAFSYSYTTPTAITCGNLSVPSTLTNGTTKQTVLTIPCAAGGSSATVTVLKTASAVTTIYANGYNLCNTSDPKRIERGLRAQYGS